MGSRIRGRREPDEATTSGGEAEGAVAFDRSDGGAEHREIQRDVFLAAEREDEQHPVDDERRDARAMSAPNTSSGTALSM